MCHSLQVNGVIYEVGFEQFSIIPHRLLKNLAPNLLPGLNDGSVGLSAKLSTGMGVRQFHNRVVAFLLDGSVIEWNDLGECLIC